MDSTPPRPGPRPGRPVSRGPAGRADQPQRAGDDDGRGDVRRPVQQQRRRAARHRPGRRARQHPGRARRPGVGAQVVDYRPDLGMLVIGFLPGRALDQRRLRRPRRDRRARPTPAAGCTPGPRFVGDFDMFARQAAYRARCASTGSRCPPAYDDLRGRVGARTAGADGSPAPTVPCNNDLLAGNFIDDGDRDLADRLRVLRQQRRRLRARQHLHRVRLARSSRRAGRRVEPTAALRRGSGRGSSSRRCAREYGWALWGFIQAATSPLDFDFHGWGMERFEKAARHGSGSDGFDGLLDRRRAGERGTWPDLPARARGRGDHRRGRDRLLDGLPPGQARLDRRARCSSRARSRAVPPGTPRDSSACCGPARAAPGWCSTPPSSTPASRPRPGCRPATARSAG